MDEPHFDCAVKAGGQEGVGIFKIKGKICVLWPSYCMYVSRIY